MSELKASNQKELSDISIAELISHSAEQNLEQDVSRDFNKVERGNCPLIVGTATWLTPKPGVPEMGRSLQTRELSGVTVRAVHQ